MIHEAAHGFARAADLYERARPGYPDAALEQLAAEFALDASKNVLDLGAGTGKLTRQLLATGARVIAVEPLAEMREQLAAAVPSVEPLEGTAEAIPLPDRSVDLVTAASAFHWFDGERAVAEIHRVLRPGGGLALLWNARDASVEWVRDVSAVLERAVRAQFAPGEYETARRLGSGAWREAFAATTLFTALEEREHPHEHELDLEDHVARFLSVSYIALLPEAERARVAAEIEALLRGHPQTRGRGRFAMPYRTQVYVSRRRDD